MLFTLALIGLRSQDLRGHNRNPRPASPGSTTEVETVHPLLSCAASTVRSAVQDRTRITRGSQPEFPAGAGRRVVLGPARLGVVAVLRSVVAVLRRRRHGAVLRRRPGAVPVAWRRRPGAVLRRRRPGAVPVAWRSADGTPGVGPASRACGALGRAVPLGVRCAQKWPLRALAVAKTRPQGPTGRVGAGLLAGSPPR